MKKTKFFGVLILLCLCFGLAMLSDLPKFIKYQKGDIKDFETLEAGELQKGDLVQGIIDITDGCIAENEQTNTTFGIETSKHTTARYYAVYMYNGMYILYETGNQAQYQTLDALTKECEIYNESLTEAFENDEDADLSSIERPSSVLEFTGAVKEMPDDLYAIFREWYGDGFENECETVLISYSNFSGYLRMILIGAGCIVLAVVFLILLFVTRKKDKQFSY